MKLIYLIELKSFRILSAPIIFSPTLCVCVFSTRKERKAKLMNGRKFARK